MDGGRVTLGLGVEGASVSATTGTVGGYGIEPGAWVGEGGFSVSAIGGLAGEPVIDGGRVMLGLGVEGAVVSATTGTVGG